MAAFNFPASPSNGDTYTLNNVDYTYNGTVWKKTSSGLTDGDKGDITVSNSLATFTIDNDAVSYAKIQNVSTTDRILGRDSAGAGVIEEITPANLRTMLNVADGAEVNVQADWSSSSGDSQILNKPTIPSNIGDLSNVSSSTPSTNQILKWNGSVWSPAADNTSSGSGTTDLSNTANGTSLTIESSSGNNTSLPAATTSAWGVMTDDDKANLDANTAKVTNATHTGDVTGATSLTIANDAVTTDKINLISTSSVPSLEAKGDGSSQDGYIQLNCSQNSHGVKLKSPPHSANASYTLTLPNDTGSANQVLKTDGSGGLDWVDQTTNTDTTYSAGTGLTLTGTTFSVDTLNQNTTGSAATLTTPRAINGVNFDGSADITIADSTKMPLAGGTFTGTIIVEDAINENVFAITDASSVALDPDNGMVQTWTLGANRTATDSLTTGQSMLLIITASSSNYTLTWPTIKWNGGSAPTLGGANATAIELFKVGSQLYGATVGDLS